MLLNMIFFVVATIIIVVTSVMILVLVRRVLRESRQGMRWQGVMTVALTGVAYCVSFLPISVYHIVADMVRLWYGQWILQNRVPL